MGVAETPEKNAMSTSIDKEDIESLENGDWIQDTCIRHIICEQLNLRPELTREGYNVVDPSWVAQWALNNFHPLEETPAFLISENCTPLRGLAIPMHVSGNHWVAIHVSFEKNTIHVYDSLKSPRYTQEIDKIMFRFAAVFRRYFQNYQALLGQVTINEEQQKVNRLSNGWYPNEPCAQQKDSVSCGIYACANVVRIMRCLPPVPVGHELSQEQLSQFRHDKAVMMKERKALGDIVFDVLVPILPEDPNDINRSTTPALRKITPPPSPPTGRDKL